MIKTAHAGNFTQKKTKEIRVKDSLVSNRVLGYVCFVLFPGEFFVRRGGWGNIFNNASMNFPVDQSPRSSLR